jgi:hypothetical protein
MLVQLRRFPKSLLCVINEHEDEQIRVGRKNKGYSRIVINMCKSSRVSLTNNIASSYEILGRSKITFGTYFVSISESSIHQVPILVPFDMQLRCRILSTALSLFGERLSL